MTIRSKSSHLVIPVGAFMQDLFGLALVFGSLYGFLLVT